jgi:hypothetical protein
MVQVDPMRIDSVTGSPAVIATRAIDAVSSTSSRAAGAAGAAVPAGAPASEAVRISRRGDLLAKLETLHEKDPQAFAATMSKVADTLTTAAASATDSRDAQQLTDVAARFRSAGETGNLSALAPPGHGAPPGGGAPPHPPGGGGGPPHPPGGGGGPPPARAVSSSSSSVATDPADANQDGKVSAKERLAYDTEVAAKKGAASHAAGTYAKLDLGHEPSAVATHAFDAITSIVDQALA